MPLNFYFNFPSNVDSSYISTLTIADKATYSQAQNGVWVAAELKKNSEFSSSLKPISNTTMTGNFSGAIQPEVVMTQSRVISYKLHYIHTSRQSVSDAVNALQIKLLSCSINCDNFGNGTTVGGRLLDSINVEYGTLQSLFMATLTFSISYSLPYALSEFKSAQAVGSNEVGLVCLRIPSAYSSSSSTATIQYVSSVSTIATCKVNFSSFRNKVGYVLLTDSGAYHTSNDFSTLYRCGGGVSGKPILLSSGMRYDVNNVGEIPGRLGVMVCK